MKFLLASALTILASANAASLPDCQVQDDIDGYTQCAFLMGSVRGGNDVLYCASLEDCQKVFPDPVFEVVEEVEEEFEVSALIEEASSASTMQTAAAFVLAASSAMMVLC